MDKYIVEERLALTEDDRVVPEADPDARWLYAIPGAEISLEEAEHYGLVEAWAKSEDVGADPEQDDVVDEAVEEEK